MKVAFICSSLEPGRDGVGDYCRMLGSELTRQGHQILVLAINDRWCHGVVEEAVQGLSVLRCGSVIPLKQRMASVQKYLQVFGPDWISLQFVCFGYDPKGLGWRWNSIFGTLGRQARHRHLMFHELWIGEGGYSNTRRRLVGICQRWLIGRLHRRFQPALTTTSSALYQRRLDRRGIKSQVVPLFGNISVASGNDERIRLLFTSFGSQLVQGPRGNFLNGVFFGGFHPDFKVAPLVAWLQELQKRQGRRLLLSLIGRCGNSGDLLVKQIHEISAGAVEVVVVGEQSMEIISQALRYADFGINTGSPEFLAKSGTFAAMREHGLPVVLADGQLDSEFSDACVPPIVQFSSSATYTAILRKTSPGFGATGVAGGAADLLRLFAATTAGANEKIRSD